MEDIDELPQGLRSIPLPPIGATPRHSVETTQPQSLNTPRTPRSNSRVSPSPRWAAETTEDKPRRSLKQVAEGHRDWSHNLCSCYEEKKSCVITCICPCIPMWIISESLGEPCFTAWLPCACVAIRTKVRAAGGIKGSVLSDCCLMTCCPWLAICQLSKEVDHMEIQPEHFVKPLSN